jgi:hypothetical protein
MPNIQVRYPLVLQLGDERITQPPKYKEGDKLIYVNHYGVYIGSRTVTKLEFWLGETYVDWRYYIDPTDAPWYPVSEKCLISEEEFIQKMGINAYNTLKAGKFTKTIVQQLQKHFAH